MPSAQWVDQFSGKSIVTINKELTITLTPFQRLWLKESPPAD
jgi:hypothetical protein